MPAGYYQFPGELVRRVLGEENTRSLEVLGCYADGVLNMTCLGLHGSRYIKGVAMRHGEKSRGMFPRYPIRAITNGVHAGTLTAVPFRDLYDRHIPEWRQDSLYLRYAISIPLEEIRAAHLKARIRVAR